jgi:hypothetical protein
MARYLFIMSWQNAARYEMIQERVAGMDGVKVILDRRLRERRRRDEPAGIERRRIERREQDVDATLEQLGWALVVRPTRPLGLG